MSKFGDVLKNGWHPEKQGKQGKSGGTTSLRGQVKGLVGRGEESSDDRYKDHVSRPLHTLTDPSSLPPPPQRRGTGLAPIPVSSSGGDKRKVVAAPSKYQDPHGPRVEPPPRVTREPDHEQQEAEEEAMAPQPPRPYRTNTTGLQTDHLPPPPGRRDGANRRSPPSYSAATNTTGATRAVPALPGRPAAGAASPSLPPRLPPRGAATPPSASPQSTGNGGGGGLLNHGAVNRLGAAGVSVPGLGIGKSNTGSSTTSQQQQQQQQGGNHMNELQNRFARFNTSSTTPQQEQQQEPAAAAAPQGTTWAQKQAALKTASQFNKDPSQVSFADAKAAAGTANNFRQRHGEQVAAGYGKAQGWNQKYGVADKVGGFASKFGGAGGGAQEQQQEPAAPRETGVVGAAAKKKPPPPPPPKKKPGLAATAAAAPGAEDGAPPPIPMSTRPNF